MAARNAASVLPEPVGAAISTSRPDWIAGHARTCASVGASNADSNQAETAGWKVFMKREKSSRVVILQSSFRRKPEPGGLREPRQSRCVPDHAARVRMTEDRG